MNKNKVITNEKELREYLVFKHQLKKIGKIANTEILTNYQNVYFYVYDSGNIKEVIIQVANRQEIDLLIHRYRPTQEHEKQYALLTRALATLIHDLKISVRLCEEPYIYNLGVEPVLSIKDVYTLLGAFNLVKDEIADLEIERKAIREEITINQKIYDLRKEEEKCQDTQKD